MAQSLDDLINVGANVAIMHPLDFLCKLRVSFTEKEPGRDRRTVPISSGHVDGILCDR